MSDSLPPFRFPWYGGSDDRGDQDHADGATAEGLRMIAAKDSDGARVRRLLALSLILEGHSREEAARQATMDRQTLRDWVHRGGWVCLHSVTLPISGTPPVVSHGSPLWGVVSRGR